MNWIQKLYKTIYNYQKVSKKENQTPREIEVYTTKSPLSFTDPAIESSTFNIIQVIMAREKKHKKTIHKRKGKLVNFKESQQFTIKVFKSYTNI